MTALVLDRWVASSAVVTQADIKVYFAVTELCDAGRGICFARLDELKDRAVVARSTLKASLRRLVELGALIKQGSPRRPIYRRGAPSAETAYQLEPGGSLRKELVCSIRRLFPLNDWVQRQLALLERQAARKRRQAAAAAAAAPEPPPAPPQQGPPQRPPIELPLKELPEPGSASVQPTRLEQLSAAAGRVLSEFDGLFKRKRSRNHSLSDLNSDPVRQQELKREAQRASRRRSKLSNLLPGGGGSPKGQPYSAGSLTEDVDSWTTTRMLHFWLYHAHKNLVPLEAIRPRGRVQFDKPVRFEPKLLANADRLFSEVRRVGYRTNRDVALLLKAWMDNWDGFVVEYITKHPKAFGQGETTLNPAYWYKAWGSAWKILSDMHQPMSRSELLKRVGQDELLTPTVDESEKILSKALPEDLVGAARRVSRDDSRENYSTLSFAGVEELIESVCPEYSRGDFPRALWEAIIASGNLHAVDPDEKIYEAVAKLLEVTVFDYLDECVPDALDLTAKVLTALAPYTQK